MGPEKLVCYIRYFVISDLFIEFPLYCLYMYVFGKIKVSHNQKHYYNGYSIKEKKILNQLLFASVVIQEDYWPIEWKLDI